MKRPVLGALRVNPHHGAMERSPKRQRRCRKPDAPARGRKPDAPARVGPDTSAGVRPLACASGFLPGSDGWGLARCPVLAVLMTALLAALLAATRRQEPAKALTN